MYGVSQLTTFLSTDELLIYNLTIVILNYFLRTHAVVIFVGTKLLYALFHGWRDMHRMHSMITGLISLIFNLTWTEPTGVKSLVGELKLLTTWWTHICLAYTASLVHGDFLKPVFIKNLLPRTTICSTVPSLTTHGYWEDPRLQTPSPTRERRTGTII